MTRLFQILLLLLREARADRPVPRVPEPEAAMTGPAAVTAFHGQGDEGGALRVPYLFNARVLSTLLPEGGTLLDLGSGSGQFLRVLARGRPDVRILGLDLSAPMVSRGRELLAEAGLDQRVELRVGT